MKELDRQELAPDSGDTWADAAFRVALEARSLELDGAENRQELGPSVAELQSIAETWYGVSDEKGWGPENKWKKSMEAGVLVSPSGQIVDNNIPDSWVPVSIAFASSIGGIGIGVALGGGPLTAWLGFFVWALFMGLGLDPLEYQIRWNRVERLAGEMESVSEEVRTRWARALLLETKKGLEEKRMYGTSIDDWGEELDKLVPPSRAGRLSPEKLSDGNIDG